MKICVVGGGASGMVASIVLARAGQDVILIDKNDKLGKKLYITGKGRCNITNDCDVPEFLTNIVHGEKFLMSALNGFTPTDAMTFFEDLGLKLVVERGNRVFPMSQKSSDVIKALTDELKRLRIEVRFQTLVESIKKKESGFTISSQWEKFECDKVIVATGGKSYPSTGSTGDGYAFAKLFGHKIIEPKAALASILVAENIENLQGISLKNVTLTAKNQAGNVLAEEFGEMIFTNRGLSGPIALSVSSYITRAEKVKLYIDLKPALDNIKLENRLLRDFEERKNQDLKNVSRALLPERLNCFVLAAARLSEWKKVNVVTKDERDRLIETIKNLSFTVTGISPFEEAVITSGGVDTKSLKPSMESAIVPGLYFVGEVVDIDALTGGFNLQLAYSTAVQAAKSIIKTI